MARHRDVATPLSESAAFQGTAAWGVYAQAMEASTMVEEAKVRQPADAEGAEKEGAAPIHVPGPSLWPAALGLGVALLLFGVLTHWAFSLAGAALFVAALGNWIAQIRRESSEGSTEHDAHT